MWAKSTGNLFSVILPKSVESGSKISTLDSSTLVQGGCDLCCTEPIVSNTMRDMKKLFYSIKQMTCLWLTLRCTAIYKSSGQES